MFIVTEYAALMITNSFSESVTSNNHPNKVYKHDKRWHLNKQLNYSILSLTAN